MSAAARSPRTTCRSGSTSRSDARGRSKDATQGQADDAAAPLRAREAVLREILDVISRSRDDEGPVFDAVLEAASRRLEAKLAVLTLAGETRTHVVVPAHRGATTEFGAVLDVFSGPIGRSEPIAVRPVAEGEAIRIDDMKDAGLHRSGEPRRLQMGDVEGVHSVVGAPLMKDGAGLGPRALHRRVIAPFADDDAARLEAFAMQTVVAIDDVPRFGELQTRLPREAATRGILSAISRDRDDRTPVFEVIHAGAASLRGARSSGLLRVAPDGDARRRVSHAGEDEGYAACSARDRP
ncbi:MAG: GAF domain-containing protein, partial [Pseudomonadota bacterium]